MLLKIHHWTVRLIEIVYAIHVTWMSFLCINVACPNTYRYCEPNGRCLDPSLICNSRRDCPDDSDETNCSQYTTHSLSNFLLADLFLIIKTRVLCGTVVEDYQFLRTSFWHNTVMWYPHYHIVVLFYLYVSISVCVGLCITTCICPAFYAVILVINIYIHTHRHTDRRTLRHS